MKGLNLSEIPTSVDTVGTRCPVAVQMAATLQIGNWRPFPHPAATCRCPARSQAATQRGGPSLAQSGHRSRHGCLQRGHERRFQRGRRMSAYLL